MPKLSKYKKSLKTMLWSMSIHFKHAKGYSIVYVLTSIFRMLEQLAETYVIALIIDEIINQLNQEQAEIQNFIPFLLLIVGIRFVFSINSIINGDFASFIRRLTIDFAPRQMLYEKLNNLDIEAIENSELQDKINRFNSNTWSLNQTFMNLVDAIALLIFSIISFIAISSLNIYIAILLLAIAVPGYLSNLIFIKKLWQLDKDITESRRKAYGVTWSIVNPDQVKEVKLIGGFKYISSIFENYFHDYFGKFKKIRYGWIGASILTRSINFIGVGVAIYFLFGEVLSGNISTGLTIFYLGLITGFYISITRLFSMISNLNEVSIRASEMREVIQQERARNNGKVELEAFTTPPQIELRNVWFKYPGTKKYIYKNLNLSINPGEKIAIVGANGAGKTTLVKLITKIYQVTKGEILVNGVNINEFSDESWYKNLGLLFQDFNTYGDLTAFENIALGRMDEGKEIDYDEIKNAAEKADALEFIEEYPNKFSQKLSQVYEGGIKPSTGQWQKIAIARFFYRNAPLLILDEPTASIDAVAEANIFDRIYKFIKNKTVIIISHRFSTVRNADRIIVIDKGEVAEDGAHEELLKNDGVYARSFKLQAKGYN